MMRSLLVLLFSGIYLVSNAANFTSNASGNWNVSGTWTHTGFDADNIPDSDDNVTIQNNHTVTLQGVSDCVSLTVNAACTLNLNNRNIRVRGNFTRTGVTTSTGQFFFYGNPATIAITGTYSNGGNWNIMTGANVTIASGTIIKTNYFFVQSGAALTNLASVNLTSETVTCYGTGTFTNGATGTIAVADPFVGTAANFNFTAVGNRVRYTTGSTTILHDPYYHLDLLSSTTSTKTWSGGTLTVAGDLRIFSGTTLNCASQNITVGGIWGNYGGINITNPGTVSFVGTNHSIISANTAGEQFGSVIVSCSGTLTLSRGIICTGDLTLSSGTFDVSTNNWPVQIRGSLFDDAVFNTRQGTVTFNGSAAQTIDGLSTTRFYNLTINNNAGVSVNFTKEISNILTVTAGAFGPSMFGSLVLTVTSPTVYARIAPLGPTGSLVGGTWSVQTYVNGPATAYWQFMSAPTANPTLQDWDGDNRFYMSGVGGNDGNACCPVFRSVRTYNEPSNTYSNVTSVTQVLAPARGFMIWMGDNINTLTAPLIFDTRGTPNQGNVNRAVTAGGAGGGYNLVGNPYACPVTYSSVVAASSATLSPNFVVLQEDGTYATNPNGGTIAPAQGFMCLASSAGNITFTESCKTTVALPNVIRQSNEQTVRVRSGNSVNGLGEEISISLDAAGDKSYDAMYDLPYLPSPYENATHLWSSNSNGDRFLLNNLGTNTDHLMIPLTVVTSTIGTQSVTFKDLNTVNTYNCAWLEDLSTGARINLNETDVYQFDESEMGATRSFILHFERTNECVSDLTATTSSLEAQTNVFVNGGQVFATFDFADESMVLVSMYDMGGRMIMGETAMNVSKQTVALENPDSHGIYLVRIQKGDQIITKKFYY